MAAKDSNNMTAWQQFFWSLGIAGLVKLGIDVILEISGKKPKTAAEIELEKCINSKYHN